MDILFGSGQKISEDLRNRFLNYSSLGEFRSIYPTDYLCLLRQTRGEILIITNERLEIIFDGYIPGVLGKVLEKKISELADQIVIGSTVDFTDYSGLFNLCIRHKNSGDIFLASDPSALLPLYFNITGGVFYFCSHMHIMGSILNPAPDFAGIAQKVTLGYPLGARTLYCGISRLNPGERIIFRSSSCKIESSYGKVYYTEYGNEKHIERLLYESLLESFDKMHNSYATLGLMLSEGFDSRLLGGIAKAAGIKIESFTHGICGTYGQKITERVADSLQSNHFFCELKDGFPLEKKKLSDQLKLSDNLNVPFWIFGAEYYRNQNANYPVVIGTALDSTLGGHAFYKPSRPAGTAVKQRYSEIIKQDFGMITSTYIESLSRSLLDNIFISDSTPLKRSITQTLNTDLAYEVINGAKYFNEHLTEEFDRLRSTGSILSSQTLQRFFLEHRARKFSFGQELTIRMHNKIFIPSYEYNFMKHVSCINPILKLHHKLYLRLLRKYTPHLLRISNGGYGIPAIFPRVVMESSRFINKKLEKGHIRKLLENHGALSPSKFRSALITDYCFRDKTKIDEFMHIVEENKSVFNVTELGRYFEKVRDYKARPFTHGTFYQGLEICQVLNGHF